MQLWTKVAAAATRCRSSCCGGCRNNTIIAVRPGAGDAHVLQDAERVVLVCSDVIDDDLTDTFVDHISRTLTGRPANHREPWQNGSYLPCR